MKRLKIKKQFGVWYYEILKYDDVEFPVYVLQKEDKTDGGEFGSYADMKHYAETGEILG